MNLSSEANHVLQEFVYQPLALEAGELSMQRDRELFARAQRGEMAAVLRFYRWADRCVSFGRTQGIAPQAAQSYRELGYNIVARPTGGGLVVHENDLCFTLVWTDKTAALPWNVRESYERIHAWIQESLGKLGVEGERLAQNPAGGAACAEETFANPVKKSNGVSNGSPGQSPIGSLSDSADKRWCFSAPVCQDILLGRRKIVGGAQWRSKGVALHQGSIQHPVSDAQIEIFKQQFAKQFSVQWTEQ